MNCLWGFTIFVMLGLDKTQVFWPGTTLTSVIDMFMFLLVILTPVCYNFLNVIFISLSILKGCFNTFERS